MRMRQIRKKYKKIIIKLTSVSSEMYHLLRNYKLLYVNYVHKTEFFIEYFRFQSQCAPSKFDHDQYCVPKKKFCCVVMWS